MKQNFRITLKNANCFCNIKSVCNICFRSSCALILQPRFNSHSFSRTRCETCSNLTENGRPWVPWWGARRGDGEGAEPPCSKKCFEGGPTVQVIINFGLINDQCFHIQVCRTKISNRDWLEHWAGNILLFCDAIIPHCLWGRVCVMVCGSDFTITSRVCRQNWRPVSCQKRS